MLEALVYALIHRDYLIIGSEIHIDIYDNRLVIVSPGGMADGTRFQARDNLNASSTRRNPSLRMFSDDPGLWRAPNVFVISFRFLDAWF